MYQKGIDLLAACIPAVLRRHPEVNFVIGEEAQPVSNRGRLLLLVGLVVPDGDDNGDDGNDVDNENIKSAMHVTTPYEQRQQQQVWNLVASEQGVAGNSSIVRHRV